MDIGFVGLGHMGHGMARNLLKTGDRPGVYNRTRDKADDLAKDGAKAADRPAGVATGNATAGRPSRGFARARPACTETQRRREQKGAPCLRY